MSSNRICVIAANNTYTEEGKFIDYIQLANIAAERAKYYLDLPTFIITEDKSYAKKFKSFAGIIEHNPTKINRRAVLAGNDHITYKWYNDSRIDAFDLTKDIADKILMIDADYMIASDQLSVWLKTDYPFLIFNSAYDITGLGVYKNNYFPSNDIVQRWATAICWTNTEEAQAVFSAAKMVRENYDFYSTMLEFPKSPFRNDLAFSVACHLLNISLNNTIKLFNLIPSCTVEYSDKIKEWLIYYDLDKCMRWNYDLHILNKNYAMDYELMNNLRLQNVEA